MIRDDLYGHDISADQITVIPDENKSVPGREDMDGDDPRRLVGHDISADQITVNPDENKSVPGREELDGNDPRRLVGHDVPYISL